MGKNNFEITFGEEVLIKGIKAKQIIDTPNYVLVNGKIWSEYKNNYRVLSDGANGYKSVSIFKEGGCKSFTIHRLVARAFLPFVEEYNVVHHLNADRKDNSVENLKWVTDSGNSISMVEIGNHATAMAILELDKKGKQINRWTSACSLGKELEITSTTVRTYIREHKLWNGRKFVFENEEHYTVKADYEKCEKPKGKLFLDRYIVTKKGQIYSLFSHRYMMMSEDEKGYQAVCLTYEVGKSEPYRVHQVVAKCYIPNPDNKPEVNHIDNNPSNNCVLNLQWCTSYENSIHARDHGGSKKFCKSVDQFDAITLEKLRTFSSVTETINAKYSSYKVIARSLKRIPTGDKYIYRFSNDETPLEVLKKVRTIHVESNSVLKTFKNIAEAACTLNISVVNLLKMIKERTIVPKTPRHVSFIVEYVE